MKNLVIAINEENATRYYVIMDSDIETGKAYAYNPEVGCKVIAPYKTRNAFQSNYIKQHPFQWMIDFDTSSVEIPNNWMK